MSWLPIVVIVLGNVFYHLGQRSVPTGVNPVVATLAAYLAASVMTLATIPLLARDLVWRTAWSSLNSSTLLVALGAMLVELGFLLAYRAGWAIGNASVTANAIVSVVLLGIGALVLREPASASRVLGVGVCLFGLWLVTRPA
jgi:drug/metabolite transporter (DMT)-like permease